MDLTIAAILAQDGITNGAIYTLLALALVLVFAVTRVIFVPQGEMVAYGALTVASLQQRMLPGTVWLLLALGIATAILFAITGLRLFGGAGLTPLTTPLPFYAYPFLAMTLIGWAWVLTRRQPARVGSA